MPLLGMDEVWKLVRIANEKDRRVVAHQVPIAFFSVKLQGKPAHVTLGIGGTQFAGHRREACEHFGIDPVCKIADFLPEPDVPVIEIDPASAEQQTIIHDTVQQVYVINRDDFNTREILIVDEDKRGQWFDDLRKNYPVRREFQNTRIVMKSSDKELEGKLKGIGFKL